MEGALKSASLCCVAIGFRACATKAVEVLAGDVPWRPLKGNIYPITCLGCLSTVGWLRHVVNHLMTRRNDHVALTARSRNGCGWRLDDDGPGCHLGASSCKAHPSH